MRRYRIKIHRFNPALDNEPRYDSYTFAFDYHPTILQVLRKVRDEHDSTLAFRESCGLGKCGSCAVMMNGDPVLACRTPLVKGEAVIEPLGNHEIVRDLVVDRSAFHDRLRETRAFHAHPDYLEPGEKAFYWSKRFSELSNCIGCLICDSACPAFGHSESDFPGPALLVQLSRSLNHPLAVGNEAHVAWIDGIHNCTACMTCEYVCPKHVDPFRNSVLSLRSAIAEKNLSLPEMQKALSDQYTKTGSAVQAKHTRLEHEVIDTESKRALFLGCMFTDRYPEQGEKVLDLLSAMDIKVQIPEGMVCCGGPLLWVGNSEHGREAFERNIEILVDSKIEQVITPCPGCGLVLKKDYADFYKEKTGKKLPFTIVDMVEVLSSKESRIDYRVSKPIRVAYHSPCHYGKGQGLFEKSALILQDPNIELVETRATTMCCGGMTASSNWYFALELSSKIIGEAERSEADILFTACVLCRDNLRRAARHKRSKVKVEHILVPAGTQSKNKR